MKHFSFIVGLLLAVMNCGETSATAAQGILQQRHFEGASFVEGVVAGIPVVHLGDGYLPAVTAADEIPDEYRLPRGTGGMVVFCYVQNIGGKLEGRPGFQPVAGAAVELRRGALRIGGRTDINGYLVLAVPAGRYDVTVLGQRKQARVETGKSELVAVRTGKRMVD